MESPERVPARWRTVGYLIAVVGGPLVAAVVGIVAVWLPGWSEQVNETGAIVAALLASVAGGLGYAYRPTRQ